MPLSIAKIKIGFAYIIKKVFHRKYAKFDISWWTEKKLKHSKKGSIKVHLYKNKFKIYFKDPASFLHTVNELFVDELYKFKPKNDSPYIIDCGSYIGTSILYFKINYPNSKILAFEPDENNFLLLSQNVNSWEFENVSIFNQAIWTNNDYIIFDSLGEMSGKIIDANVSATSSKKIQSRRLYELLNTKVDFLKIDIEGAEYEVIIDCESRLANVDNIFLEFHSNYNEIHRLNKILNILVENKFSFYIKEAGTIYKWPLYETKRNFDFDVQLNIFAFKSR